jgi:hypothetical protein
VTEVYRNDLKIRVSGGRSEVRELDSKRGKIQGWSKASRSRFRLALRNTEHLWTHEIALTYGDRFPMSGKLVKRDQDTFIKALERRYPGINWIWRTGFQQERGIAGKGYAPHTHVVTDRYVDKRWLSKTWYRIAGRGDDKMLTAATHVDKIRGKGRFVVYMLGYLGKRDECVVPEGYTDVGQFWGMRRGVLVRQVLEKTAPSIEAAMRDLRGVRRWYQAEVRDKYHGKWKSPQKKGMTACGGRRFYDCLPEDEQKKIFGGEKGEKVREVVDMSSKRKRVSETVSGVSYGPGKNVSSLLQKYRDKKRERDQRKTETEGER